MGKKWKKAINADEPEFYYRVSMYNGGSNIRKYKPSVVEYLKTTTGVIKYELLDAEKTRYNQFVTSVANE